MRDQQAMLRHSIGFVFALGYVQGETVKVFGDAAGMQTVYYGHVEGRPYVVSHAALVGVLEGLVLSDYVRRLVSYRFYHLSEARCQVIFPRTAPFVGWSRTIRSL